MADFNVRSIAQGHLGTNLRMKEEGEGEEASDEDKLVKKNKENGRKKEKRHFWLTFETLPLVITFTSRSIVNADTGAIHRTGVLDLTGLGEVPGHAPPLDHGRSHRDAGAVEVENIPDVAAELVAEKRLRKSKGTQVIAIAGRDPAEEHVVVLSRVQAEVGVGAHGHLGGLAAVHEEDGLHAVPADLHPVPLAVVQRVRVGLDVHVAVLLRHEVDPQPDGAFGQGQLQVVVAPVVVRVQQQRGFLSGSELEGDGSILAGVPFGVAGVGFRFSQEPEGLGGGGQTHDEQRPQQQGGCTRP